MAIVLRELGHDTCVAYSPVLALSIAASFQPQVALLDIDLPNMTGYELADRLRGFPALAQCRFIAVTGFAYERDRRKSEAAGFYRHLVKPFGVDALIDAVAASDPAASCAPPAGWSVG